MLNKNDNLKNNHINIMYIYIYIFATPPSKTRIVNENIALRVIFNIF